MADIQQFDSRSLSCQALKSQLDIRETLELDLKSQALFNTGVPLGIYCGFRVCANRVQLPS